MKGSFIFTISLRSGSNSTFLSVALMDLGFSSHAFHSGNRVVFMDAELSSNGKTLKIMPPPNNRVYPPGPGARSVSGSRWFSKLLAHESLQALYT